MKTVGKQLQDARLEKGWSPELAARETKIRVDRLHELESDDYSNFSSPTYARGFVRTYARALGMDEYKILRQLDNKLPEDDNASFANDTGVPYMPQPSQVARPFEVGKGVYIAAAVGITVLLLIGFILVQVYRAGYFAQALPAPVPLPATNALPVAPDTETAQRALPADSSAPPIALPVDTTSAVTTAPAAPPATALASPAAPADTNAPLRALPVDPAALATATNEAPVAPVVSTATTNATSGSPASPSTTTTPIDTSTPPRAMPVDPNTLSSAQDAGSATPSGPVPTKTAVMSVENSAPINSPTAPAVQPRPASSLSARQSNARPHAPVVVSSDSPATEPAGVPTDAAPPSDPIVATTTPEPGATALTDPPAAPNSATQSIATEAPSEPAASDAAPAPAAPLRALPVVLPSSETESTPAPSTAPDSASALTGGDSAAPGDASESPQDQARKNRGKRLILTASQDSFVRVVALDGVHGDHVRYSSMLHSGQSISFSDRKYTINVGDPAAVDISLDGINYGPHSDHSQPDTFTVESRQP
jgi:cytoskeleton protein RodZ